MVFRWPLSIGLNAVFLAFPLLTLTACLQDEAAPNPPPVVDSTANRQPSLAHTRSEIRVPVGTTLYDTLFIRDGKNSEWQFYLVDGSPGVTIQGNVLSYSAVDTLTSVKHVSVAAKHIDGKILTASWEFRTGGLNHYPVLVRRSLAQWIVVGEVWRETLTVYDADGDSLFFTHTLPEGAEFKDSVFTWTPKPNQVGNVTSSIQVWDGLGGAASVGINLNVFASDPEQLSAQIETGRTWWIEAEHVGMNYPIRNQYDSVQLRRRIEIRYHNPETDSFIYAIFDTLTGTRNEVTELEVPASMARNSNFYRGNHSFSDIVPFGWAQPSELILDTAYAVGATRLSGKYFIFPNTCLTNSGSKTGCGGGSATWVPGWGKIAGTLSGNGGIMNETYRYHFRVWAIKPN